jgi:hypothetical protein
MIARQPAGDRPADERIDWSQLWYPGPRREFTADELARAGQDRPSRTFLMLVLFNLVTCAGTLMQLVPGPALPWAIGLVLAALYPAYRASMWLWRQPTRRRLMGVSLGVMVVFAGAAFGLKPWLPERELRLAVATVLGVMAMTCVLAFWILAVARSQQIAARPRELAERERAIEMARQLAAAQIQPHFIFNTLATLQHWVDSGDARAAPLLASLTGYLRATLPLFQRQQLTLGEELDAAARYLEVMQARLGERLHFVIEADAAARAQVLPPGLLLTLVENAVEHGVQPSLHGAELHVSARREAAHTVVEVSDSGPGLAQPHADGLGLTNSRARLAQLWGEQARLELGPRAEGGTRARLLLPLQLTNPAAPGVAALP